jgi:hypothetical protein
MVIANNILVGITGTPPAKATVKGNVMYAIGDHQTGWKTAANYPGNIIVKADDGSARPNYFEGSGNFFVGRRAVRPVQLHVPQQQHARQESERGVQTGRRRRGCRIRQRAVRSPPI